MYPVELSGHVVRLREFQAEDVAASLSVVADPRVTRWLSYDNRSEAEAEAMIRGAMERAKREPRTEYYLAVTLEDVFVGFGRIGIDGVRAGKLGYAIAADHWGHGYATDVAETLTDFGFSALKLHRISAAIGPDNQSSIAVARKLGMQYEGRIRHHVFTNGDWRDSLLYSVLADEWAHRPPKPH